MCINCTNLTHIGQSTDTNDYLQELCAAEASTEDKQLHKEGDDTMELVFGEKHLVNRK